MYRYKRNGFTLVELMAVITIISLIALLTFPNIINQIKKTKKSNNKMIEDVIIEQAKKYIHDNDSEYTEDDEYCIPLTKLIDNDYIKEDLTSINDIKDNKVIHLTRTNSDSYEVMDKDKCVITPTAVKYLLKKTNPITVTNYTDGDIHEMYTFEHEATEQTPALTDYRYIGSDPNNYVEFNNELWRIIGVFKVEDENGKWEERVKLIRNERISEGKKWNDNGTNEWNLSTLQLYLNNDYLASINNLSRIMLKKTKYYLGGNDIVNINGEDFYAFERGNNVSPGRYNNWIGIIGLMYPSDHSYTYALGVDNTCFDSGIDCDSSKGAILSNSWIYNISKNYVQWFITPFAKNSRAAYDLYSNGNIGGLGVTTNYLFRPALYLSSKVKITSGNGTEANPYKLSM